MATYTPNFSLKRPGTAENVLVSDINGNTTAIDTIMFQNRELSGDGYDTTKTYNTDDMAIYENVMYKCLDDGVTGNWNANKWQATNLGNEVAEAKRSGGTDVEANPSGTATGTLTKLRVDNDIYNVSGGGGSTDYEELTKTEYDALTEAEKTDGTLYFITDINGDGQSFQPVIYSEDEREIGVWKDGKPLYQKTFVVSNPVVTGTRTQIDSPTFANCHVVEIFGYVDRDATNQGAGIIMYPLNTYENGSYYANVYFDEYLGKFAYQIKMTSNTATELVVTARYTKTTDTAGSGTWTPQGVPAVHYSTDEQVVGTWIDGSTIYEKTYSLNSPVTIGTGGTSISFIDASIDNIIEFSGTYTATGEEQYFPMGLFKLNGGYKAASMMQAVFDTFTIRYTKSSS